MHPLDIALKLAIEGQMHLSEDLLRNQPQDDPRVLFNLGWHELRHGNLFAGMDLMNAGRLLGVFGSPQLSTSAPIWRGPSPTIILRSEGGLGDHIINARFATALAEYGKVIVLTHPSLVNLLSTIRGVAECLPDTITELPPHDYWVPAMSAAYVLKLNYANLQGTPYLNIKPKKLKGKFKVGLRWSGNPQFEHEQHRKFNPQLMLDLANIKGATYYSLQRDHNLIDVPFTDLRHQMTTWENTASILAGLDLVITSDTSIAHCAAALGVQVWNIVPILPYYIYAMPGNKTPWYDTMTLFRQETYGSWDAPFEKIHKELQMLISHKM
jgi:hypothetical protein